MAKKERFARYCKERMTEEIISRFKAHPNFVITAFMGTDVASLELLRKTLKRSNSDYLVVKNSMLKIVFDKLKLKDASSVIESGMGISFSGDDIISTCKALVGFAGTHDKFKIKSAVIDGRNVAPDRVKQLAAVPSKEALLAQVVGSVKAPITGFVNSLSAVLRKFVYCVEAIKNSKQ